MLSVCRRKSIRIHQHKQRWKHRRKYTGGNINQTSYASVAFRSSGLSLAPCIRTITSAASSSLGGSALERCRDAMIRFPTPPPPPTNPQKTQAPPSTQVVAPVAPIVRAGGDAEQSPAMM